MSRRRVILLVEDNAADIEIARRALRQSAADVDLVAARDGQEAVDYLGRRGPHATDDAWRRPDLILLDLNLPRLTGREVLRQVRGALGLDAVPVVVLSTSTRPEDVRDMYAAGANTYIEKPQDFSRFVEVLQTIHRYWLETAVLPPPDPSA